MNNFWKDRNNPFYILAPMEDVTDTSFREVIMSVSDPEVLNVLFTEFTSTDGLMDSRGYERVSERLRINASERKLLKERNIKLVAQIWGNDPEKFLKTAQMLSKTGDFDGIDINMGCPVKKVVKKGTCSALIKTPDLAAEIIQATKEGASIPVSVKTRIGFNTVVTEEWLGHLLEQDIAALTIHGRTQKMQSDGLADWNEIGKVVKLRESLEKESAIIGNGDVDTYAFGAEKINQYQLDGVMVGRGIFKDPWIFNKNQKEPTIEERVELAMLHIRLFDNTWGGIKNYNILKRFYKIYINSFKGAGALRAELMETKTAKEASAVLSI
jgi:tRNA-dihydrouridine synthase